jgi:general secretion pathway protein K
MMSEAASLSLRARGIALVVVLWVVTLLGVMATSFAISMRTESTLAYQWTQSAQARALAEAGVHRGIMELLLPVQQQRWRTDGTVYEFSFGGGRVRVAIQDESGKVDLNEAQQDLLKKMLRSVAVEEDKQDALADAILDWRDGNNLRSLHGAEDDDYAAAGLDHGAKDGPFNCVEELQQVLGMTPALYKRLEPMITINSRQADVEFQIAPPEVLRAFPGLAPERAGGPPPSEGFGRRGGQGSPQAGPRLPRGSGVTYTVRAAARVTKNVVSQIAATIQLTDLPRRPFSVVSWQEGGRELFDKTPAPVEPRL